MVFAFLLKLGSGCYGVDRRCGGAEVKGVAGLVESGVETEIRSSGGVRSWGGVRS